MKLDPQIFKAYDVRGKYPQEINERAVAAIAEKLPKILGRKIVVARDARLSSPALYRSVIAGIMNNEERIMNSKSVGIIRNSQFIIHAVGTATTPMFYFLVNKLKASGGIMITASHNPKEFNGLKVVGLKAKPISGKEILRIMNNEE